VDVGHDADAHGRRTLAAGAAAAVLLAAAWIGAAALLLRTRVPGDLVLPELDPRAYFSAAYLERADHVRAVTRALLVGGIAVEVAVLALLAWRGRALAARLRPRLRGDVRVGVALGLVAVVGVWLATLPLGVVSHWWSRRYDLSRQGYADWLGDRAITLGVRAVLVAIAVGGAVWLARRFGGRWWLAAAPALVALGVAYIVVQPLVVQPLFNRFSPLQDRALAAEIRTLAEREGVTVGRVEVADASRRTTTANAYVAGLGPTKRVVLYDTALDGRFTREELLVLAAHELAHVARSHLWKGLAWFALLAVPGLALVAAVTERRGGLRDPALVPLGLLAALLVFLATLPIQNAVSRRYEAEADWLALEATRDPDASIGLDTKLTETSLGDPDPPRWAVVAFGTHPPALERIAMAEAFRARLP
jgi:STE24 endopeptidase